MIVCNRNLDQALKKQPFFAVIFSPEFLERVVAVEKFSVIKLPDTFVKLRLRLYLHSFIKLRIA
jgi:hypothetical protein